jgi:serine/threonine protein kinase
MEVGSAGSSTIPAKEKGSIGRFVKKKIRRALSLSSAGSVQTISGDDDSDPHSSPEVVSCEISVEVGATAVRMAQERLTEMLNNTRFVRRRNRMQGMPSFKNDAFQVGVMLGRGAFSNVHKLEAWHCDCDLNEDENIGKQYVLKTVRAERARTPEWLAMVAADLMMEAHVLSALEHPHILALRGISTHGLSSLKRGRVDGLFLILDYLPVTLNQRLEEWKNSQQTGTVQLKDSLPERFQVVVDLASALKYLHQKNLVYRDIKPSNVGFDCKGILKLFDFGMAVEVPKTSDPNKTFLLTGRKGTPRYLSPECIKKKPYNAKTDVFGMAILTWQMLTLGKPFANQISTEDVMQSVVHGERPSLKHLPADLKPDTRAKLEELLTSGWSKEIPDRPTMKEMHAQIVEIAQGELGVDAVRTDAKRRRCSNCSSQSGSS